MQRAPKANMSREQIGEVVRSKQHFYNAMVLHGFVLPSQKQTIVSIKFMTQVRNNEVWMPRAEDIEHFKKVPYGPTNAMLVDFINSAVDSHEGQNNWTRDHLSRVRALMEIVAKKGADKDWLLKVLWCLDRDCKVFGKSYRYVKPKDKINPARIEVFGNQDGFFDDLPPLLPHEMKGRQMRMSKQDKQQLQMRVFQERQANLKRKMDKLSREMNQGQAQEEEKHVPHNGGNQPPPNQPGPNQ